MSRNVLKSYLTLILTLCIFSCHAVITQVNDMEEALPFFKDADAKTLVIFDVDMVLIQPSDPACQMPNMKQHSAVFKRIFKDVPADKQMIFLTLMTTSSNPILIDAKTPQYLQQLIQRGVPTMAMTSSLTGEFGAIKNMEKWRIENLRCLGIDFSQSAPYHDPITFDDLAPFRNNFSTYLDGVLFVNGTVVSKGDAFQSFLMKTKIAPNKVIFVDDREENLKSVEATIQKLNRQIEYQGLHYLGAQEYPSQPLSESEVESRWKELAQEAVTPL